MTQRSLSAVLAALALASPAAAQRLSYEGGLSLASGSYIFNERTTSWSLSTGVAVGRGRLAFRAALPIHLQNTALVALSGPRGIPTGGSSSGAVADTGASRERRGDGMPTLRRTPVSVPSSAAAGYQIAVGDPTAQLAWRLLGGPGPWITAAALVKVPVADTATFGTGRWDAGTGLTLGYVAGRTMLALDLTYWKLGDMPALHFRDPVNATASVDFPVRSEWGAGIMLSAGTAALPGYEGPVSVGGRVVRASGGAAWALSGTVGITETVPDFSLGLAWRVGL